MFCRLVANKVAGLKTSGWPGHQEVLVLSFKKSYIENEGVTYVCINEYIRLIPISLPNSMGPGQPDGLRANDWTTLETEFSNLNLTYIKQENFYEVDIPGIQVLNILAQSKYKYKIVSQSMAMEKTFIGGRTIQVQKLVWTLSKI